jgi:hypothetical protein
MSNTSKKTVARTDAPARRARRPSAPAPTTTVEAPTAAAATTNTTIAVVDHHQVAALAYKYYVEGGYQHGHALDHWLRAESALRGR